MSSGSICDTPFPRFKGIKPHLFFKARRCLPDVLPTCSESTAAPWYLPTETHTRRPLREQPLTHSGTTAQTPSPRGYRPLLASDGKARCRPFPTGKQSESHTLTSRTERVAGTEGGTSVHCRGSPHAFAGTELRGAGCRVEGVPPTGPSQDGLRLNLVRQAKARARTAPD